MKKKTEARVFKVPGSDTAEALGNAVRATVATMLEQDIASGELATDGPNDELIRVVITIEAADAPAGDL
jgi:hypothetical protein